MKKEMFREALFGVIEKLTHHPLSESGKKLVIHYFNENDSTTSFERALGAIEKYFPDSLPEEDERSKGLITALKRLEEAAQHWDSEE